MLTALLQGPERTSSVAANLAAIDDAAAAAARRGARILVCPEMSATGYNIGPLLTERAEPRDGPIARSVAAMAAAHGIAIVFGYPERDGDRLYNATAAIDKDGRGLAHYRKTHLFGELDRDAFTPGEVLLAQFELDGLRCGLLTCYDVEFPETARAHAVAGTDWLIVPTGLMHPFAQVAETLIPARAIENQIFITYANRVGSEGDVEYCGRSCIVAPDGAVLARAGEQPVLLFSELDPAQAARSRARYPYLADRRTDLYPQ
ncbi:carbon-nitrogen hydrolase family protein [Tomitella biformata]|uniref:carbon-nitrogen hydrolase family protein n=1 Tax=Tomitella biformata TaxID=630403 RepID=UPI0004ACC439|nr:carbon-nitrogen hydrolase family protein [Tomitella biformata]